jgi:type IV pilus assembly protein PilA
MTEPAAPDGTPLVSQKKKTLSILWAVGVVVLVLLCLGAMATPKFGGFGAKCKSRQSQAKTNLAGLFTSEKAFFGEHGYYTTDLVSVDWTPDGSPTYAYGFAVPSERATDPNLPDLDPTRRTTVDPRVARTAYRLENMKAEGGRALTEDDFTRIAPAATASEQAFLIVAIGNIDSDETLDIWTLDHGKDLQVLTNDCTR